MYKVPNWIPLKLQAYVENLNVSGVATPPDPVLEALITSSVMKPAWNTLAKYCNDSQQLIEYLHFVRQHPSVAFGKKHHGEIENPGHAEQKEIFIKLNKSLGAVLEQFQSLGSGNAENGRVVMEAALERLGNYSLEWFIHIAGLNERLQSIQHKTSIIEFLETIKEAADLAKEAPPPELPVKLDSDNARINWLMQDLTTYCQRYFGKPLDAVVAATLQTVNLTLNWSDKEVNAEDVAKRRRKPKTEPKPPVPDSTGT